MLRSKERWARRVITLWILAAWQDKPIPERLCREVAMGHQYNSGRLWYERAFDRARKQAHAYAIRHSKRFPRKMY